MIKHLWKVYLLGVKPNDGISIRDANGSVICTAIGSLKGIVALGTIILPTVGRKDLTQPSIASNDTLEKGNTGKLIVEQALLITSSVVQLEAYCKHVSAGIVNNSKAIFCVTYNRVKVYSLEDPSHPELIDDIEVPGVLGLVGYTGYKVQTSQNGCHRL